MTPTQQATSIFSLLGLILTLFFNSILIFLTVFYIRRIVPAYKYMIVTFAILGIVFTAAEHAAKPYIHNFNASFMYFSVESESSESSIDFLKLALGLYAGLYSSLISFTALQFAFRYLTLKQSLLLERYKKPLAILSIGYVILFGFMFGGSMYFLAEPDAYDDDYLREEITKVYGLEITKIPRFIVLPYHPNGDIRLKPLMCSVLCMLVISTQYLVIIFCALKMRRLICNNLSHSYNQQNLEGQFFKALLVQIILPTVLLTLPSFPVLFSPFLDLQMSVESGFIYTLFSFYTPLDSLSFMCIVSEYRVRVKGIFGDFKKPMLARETLATIREPVESII